MGIKLPEGTANEERMRRIEDRITALENRYKAAPLVDANVTIASQERDEPASTGNPEKDTLITKLLALKEANPKAVKAAPSQIHTMSVEKLSTLIAEAEATIAAEAAPSQEGAETTSEPGAGAQE